jgi:hypothetical protein
MTIYEKIPNQLIRTGDRSITAFPSGLLRVDQLYIGKSGNEPEHRSALSYGALMPGQDDTNAIDGVYIFPEVQESKDGTGFTRYQCGGYGRTTDQSRELSRTQQSIAIRSLDDLGQFVANITVIVINTTNTIVKKIGEIVTADDFTFDESLAKPFAVIYEGYPERIFTGATETNLITTYYGNVRSYEAEFSYGESTYIVPFKLIDPRAEIIAQRNFGKFTEYEVLLDRRSFSYPEVIV